LTSADSSLFDITPGAATHLAFSTQPAAYYSADATKIGRASCRESVNNLVTDSTRSINLSLSGGNTSTLGGTTPQSAVAGVVTFADLNVHTVGSAYKLAAAGSGLPALTSADSSLFDITPGAATHLAFSTQPAAYYSADAT